MHLKINKYVFIIIIIVTIITIIIVIVTIKKCSTIMIIRINGDTYKSDRSLAPYRQLKLLDIIKDNVINSNNHIIEKDIVITKTTTTTITTTTTTRVAEAEAAPSCQQQEQR